MARIFLGVVLTNLVLLLAAAASGGLSQWLDGVHAQPGIYMVHYYLGLVTVLCNLAMHCLIFVYFLGTGRLVKEIAITYGIPDEPWPKLTRELKRKTFPPSLLAMLIGVPTAATGMGIQMLEWPWLIHLGFAVALLGVNVWACLIEYKAVSLNARALEEVYREVDRIRAARGLPTNAEALQQME
jgi:predicted ferric reductase